MKNSVQPGNCWPFKGSKADLFIKLAARITPTSFSLEHIPKELSLDGTITSAPQNFTVYVSKTAISTILTQIKLKNNTIIIIKFRFVRKFEKLNCQF